MGIWRILQGGEVTQAPLFPQSDSVSETRYTPVEIQMNPAAKLCGLICQCEILHSGRLEKRQTFR